MPTCPIKRTWTFCQERGPRKEVTVQHRVLGNSFSRALTWSVKTESRMLRRSTSSCGLSRDCREFLGHRPPQTAGIASDVTLKPSEHLDENILSVEGFHGHRSDYGLICFHMPSNSQQTHPRKTTHLTDPVLADVRIRFQSFQKLISISKLLTKSVNYPKCSRVWVISGAFTSFEHCEQPLTTSGNINSVVPLICSGAWHLNSNHEAVRCAGRPSRGRCTDVSKGSCWRLLNCQACRRQVVCSAFCAMLC
mmetsp:Transcript_11774/g.18484  ORF Transcript_11774/g.18484 Transcript_11774/m.18484 type:complete len:250 (+) Transcript_11774:185-934(+)